MPPSLASRDEWPAPGSEGVLRAGRHTTRHLDESRDPAMWRCLALLGVRLRIHQLTE